MSKISTAKKIITERRLACKKAYQEISQVKLIWWLSFKGSQFNNEDFLSFCQQEDLKNLGILEMDKKNLSFLHKIKKEFGYQYHISIDKLTPFSFWRKLDFDVVHGLSNYRQIKRLDYLALRKMRILDYFYSFSFLNKHFSDRKKIFKKASRWSVLKTLRCLGGEFNQGQEEDKWHFKNKKILIWKEKLAQKTNLVLPHLGIYQLFPQEELIKRGVDFFSYDLTRIDFANE